MLSLIVNVTKSTKETGKVKTAVKKRDNKVEEATSVKLSKATKETNAFKSSKDASSKAPNSRESRGSATPLITSKYTFTLSCSDCDYLLYLLPTMPYIQ